MQVAKVIPKEKYPYKRDIVWVLNCPLCEEYAISYDLEMALSTMMYHIFMMHNDFYYSEITSRYRSYIESYFQS